MYKTQIRDKIKSVKEKRKQSHVEGNLKKNGDTIVPCCDTMLT